LVFLQNMAQFYSFYITLNYSSSPKATKLLFLNFYFNSNKGDFNPKRCIKWHITLLKMKEMFEKWRTFDLVYKWDISIEFYPYNLFQNYFHNCVHFAGLSPCKLYLLNAMINTQLQDSLS